MKGLLFPFFILRLVCTNSLLQALVQIRMAGLEIVDDFKVFVLYLGKINLFNVHQAEQLAHRFRHGTPALVAGAPTLRDTDLGPELLLIKAKFAPDVAWINDFIK